eukprot:CAMPEP_0113898634 /NCGR_PEP_ID=MMETSP0780_2-20120614/19513_1 /TAXON_ID=652834 /ORGANISM="Palpitomonas bilix" /LENGTH=541 /DNA_ID=CAMNT_0000890569 /DNA_START=30 /DNA_END=1654 /DNA_ORIENTATION=+ /assembly_acc=CAM_ASM_000599
MGREKETGTLPLNNDLSYISIDAELDEIVSGVGAAYFEPVSGGAFQDPIRIVPSPATASVGNRSAASTPGMKYGLACQAGVVGEVGGGLGGGSSEDLKSPSTMRSNGGSTGVSFIDANSVASIRRAQRHLVKATKGGRKGEAAKARDVMKNTPKKRVASAKASPLRSRSEVTRSSTPSHSTSKGRHAKGGAGGDRGGGKATMDDSSVKATQSEVVTNEKKRRPASALIPRVASLASVDTSRRVDLQHYKEGPRRTEIWRPHSPGPGAYDVRTQPGEGPHISIGRGKKCDYIDAVVKRSITPGPKTEVTSGFKKQVLSTKSTGNSFTFGGKNMRNRAHDSKQSTPGPGSYSHLSSLLDQPVSTRKSPSRMKFGKDAQRRQPEKVNGTLYYGKEAEREYVGVHSPGPGAYTPSDLTTSTRYRVKSPSMKKGMEAEWRAKDLHQKAADRIPGPGSYELQSSFAKQTSAGRATSPSYRFSLSAQRQTPADGLSKTPYISKEHEDENKGYFGPGPGQYEVTGQKYQQLSKPMNGGMRWGMEPRFGL